MALVWAIVVAGGTGQRFGRRKQFALLAGRPVAEWSVAACRAHSAGVVLVVPEGDASSDGLHGADVAVEGGATRADSVRRGLAAVPSEADVILVHDAARPLASSTLFDAVLDALALPGAGGSGRSGPVGGAVPGVPVHDTIKEVDPPEASGARRVRRTLDRGALVAVQTPQAFSAELLRKAHASGSEATDDAALIEALGATVLVVPGEPRNLKITTPDDLHTAERLLAG